MMVDKKHHLCTVDSVLEISVGTRRTRYSYQPKECRRKKKPAQLTQSHSNSPWQSLYYAGQSFSFNKNDVISTRRIYLLASCGCKNVLTHKKMVQCGRDRNVHHHPPTTKIHPQTSLYISSKCLVPSYAEFNAEHDTCKILHPTLNLRITA